MPGTNGTTRKLQDLDRAELAELYVGERGTNELLEERLWELELALEDEGWTRGDVAGEQEFSREALGKIIGRCRLFYLQNPLINHAVEVQADYVFGQGVSISGTGTANDILQRFLDDPRNLRSFSSHEAMLANEKRLPQEGNIFFALFTDPATGRVVVRHIPVEQMLAGEIISNPQDTEEVWFYRRKWRQQTTSSLTGVTEWEDREELYPDVAYRPQVRVLNIGGKKVNWDAPVYHLAVGGLPGSKWGVPELYSSLSWARAVTEDLTDYSTMRRAASRYAYLLNVKGGAPAVASAKSRLESSLGKNPDSRDSNPPPTTGSTWIQDPLLASLAGAPRVNVPNPDEGRRLGLMVAAGVGIPETILFGDADVGNLATAQTLDRPTELKFRNRQTLWTDVFKDIGAYIMLADARAPQGLTMGAATVEFDPELGTEKLVPGTDPLNLSDDAPEIPVEDEEEPVEAANEFDPTVSVHFPTVLEADAAMRLTALATGLSLKAADVDEMAPIRVVRRLVLEALEVPEIDDVLDQMDTADAEREAEDEARAATLPQPGDPDYVDPAVAAAQRFNGAVPGAGAQPAQVAEALAAFNAVLEEGSDGGSDRGAAAAR